MPIDSQLRDSVTFYSILVLVGVARFDRPSAPIAPQVGWAPSQIRHSLAGFQTDYILSSSSVLLCVTVRLTGI